MLIKTAIAVIALIAAVAIAFAIHTAKNQVDYFTGTHPVRSGFDGRIYKMAPHRGGDIRQRAERLAELNFFLLGVIRYMENKYLVRGRGNAAEKRFVKRLVSKYNPHVFVENVPDSTVNTSFVIGKGSTIAICLRSKHGNIHSLDILKFVGLHEISHIGSNKYGHTDLFWDDFKFVLQNAQESGLYHPVNYRYSPEVYCGLKITHNPLFDR